MLCHWLQESVEYAMRVGVCRHCGFCLFVCVCVRERESVCVRVCVRERERVCAHVCVCIASLQSSPQLCHMPVLVTNKWWWGKSQNFDHILLHSIDHIKGNLSGEMRGEHLVPSFGGTVHVYMYYTRSDKRAWKI